MAAKEEKDAIQQDTGAAEPPAPNMKAKAIDSAVIGEEGLMEKYACCVAENLASGHSMAQHFKKTGNDTEHRDSTWTG